MQAENYLTVTNLSVSYGKKNNKINVVNELNLSLEKGEIGCFLGYSGCGKTTALRAIAGLEETEQGDIYLDNIHLTTNASHILPPAKRGMGMVFQDYALFAHLSVADNIAFGLHKWAKDKRQKRVAEMLELVELSKHADKKPSQLSGGQQQRVALARALAPEPKLLLLDEPFSNLDIILREALASNVRDILKRTDTTAILVTHDQNEAFALADKVGVMNEGKLVQWATPNELYHQPSTPFVADFIGEGAIITATSDNGNLKTPLGRISLNNKNITDNKEVKILIRPDSIVYNKNSEIKAEVIGRAFRGANYLYHLRLADEQKIYSLISSEYHYEIGSKIAIMANLKNAVIFN